MNSNYQKILGGTTFKLNVVAEMRKLQGNQVRLLCQTNGGAITIQLPKISEWGGGLDARILIDDFDDNSSVNNITVLCDPIDSIENAASFLINSNGSKVEVYISSLNEYGVLVSNVGTGGVAPPIDVTYDEIINLRDSNSLVRGQKYQITDFRTSHRILTTGKKIASPYKTVWNSDGYVNFANYKNRTYTSFEDAVGVPFDTEVLLKDLIMWDLNNNKYYKVKFASWTPDMVGTGGFEYTRTEILSPTTFGVPVNFINTGAGGEVDMIDIDCEITRDLTLGIFNKAVELAYNPSSFGWDYEFHYGINEQLTVEATQTNEISNEAYSTLRPTDKITYYLDVVDVRDIGYTNGFGYLIPYWKGVITYREDTIAQNFTHYDFLNVVYRRFKTTAQPNVDSTYATKSGIIVGIYLINALSLGTNGNVIIITGDGVKDIDTLIAEWNLANPTNQADVMAGGTEVPALNQIIQLENGTDSSYVKGNVVLCSDGNVYKCIKDISVSIDPTTDKVNWSILWKTSTDSYISWTPDNTVFDIGNINTADVIVDANDYEDVLTFGDYYNYVFQSKIKAMSIDYALIVGTKTVLNNIVFKTGNNLANCILIDIDSLSYNMTFGNNSQQIKIGEIGNNCYFNLCQQIAIGKNCGGLSIYNATALYLDDKCDEISIGDKNREVFLGYNNSRISLGYQNTNIKIGATNFDIDIVGSNSIIIGDYNRLLFIEASELISFGSKNQEIEIGDSSKEIYFEDKNEKISVANKNSKIQLGSSNYSILLGKENENITFSHSNQFLQFGTGCYSITIQNQINPSAQIINFGDILRMCEFKNNCFVNLVAYTDLSGAAIIHGEYNKTVFCNNAPATKVSYIDNLGALIVNDVTA